MNGFDDDYVRALAATLHDEVREMVAWTVQPPVRRQAASEPAAHPDAADPDHVVFVEPLQRERLPESQVPAVTVTVDQDELRVEARGRVLEIGMREPVYHYQPDGQAPQEHAGWLAELWMEDAQ